MARIPDSLFNLVLNLVIRHIAFVESFVGFPSLIGEKIFKKFIDETNIVKDVLLQDVVKKFVDAYQNMILERLNLSKRLIILNEYFETIVTMSHFVTELCICGCSLGANHEIFNHISRLRRLKILCLKDNSISDSSMRLITLPIRMYGNGAKELEILNLAENELTDVVISWLSAFPKLQYLNLTGSDISQKGIQDLKTRYNLQQVSDENDIKEIKTEGWGATLLQNLIASEEKREKKPASRPRLHRHVVAPVIFPERRTMGTSLVFRKISPENDIHISIQPSKRTKYSDISYKKAIEDDIFSQYT